MTSEPRIHMRHVRAAKLCSRGGREWFASNGLDWQDFLDNGIEASKIVALNDPLAMRAVEAERAERE